MNIEFITVISAQNAVDLNAWSRERANVQYKNCRNCISGLTVILDTVTPLVILLRILQRSRNKSSPTSDFISFARDCC